MARAAMHANDATGQKICAARCAACHGEDGNAVARFPPVRGKDSENARAGLANVPKPAE